MYRLLLICLCMTSLFAASGPNRGVTIHNRILARANGKSISMIDVVKQLDMLFYQNYPDKRGDTEARLEFYKNFWKRVLRDIVDRELVLAEAQEKQLEVSNGDVREEMEEMFGPDVIKNVNSAGLTVQEAQKMIRSDIILRRMLYFRVKSRAYLSITPQDIEEAYNEMASDLGAREEISWQAITFKAPKEAVAKQAAFDGFQLLTQGEATPENVKDELIKKGSLKKDKDVTITSSQIFTHRKSELSRDLLELFNKLPPGVCSEPKEQRSRTDYSQVWKIYLVKGRKVGEMPQIHDMEAQIREMLTQEQIEALSEEYITNLRKHFGVNYEEIDHELQDYEPFK